jgi:MoaA/NifB/PqqE/SkfB family radical SAM enzyme/ubiquinone/menaquinone biosynthesis C-methylase UbiE
MADFSSEIEMGGAAVEEDFRPQPISESSPGIEPVTFQRNLWRRMEFDRIPIYVRSDKPDWFVPNKAGDEILKQMTSEDGVCPTITTLRFLERLPRSPKRDYQGRSTILRTDELKEIWFHITNLCNQHCSRCLFECSPQREEMLSKDRVFDLANQAYQIGCRFFLITGGEPTVHPDFVEIVNTLLAMPDCHVTVLTNAVLIGSFIDDIDRWPRERFHLQVSLDGNQTMHNHIRGAGSFDQLMENLSLLKAREIPFGVSMCVEIDNMNDLPEVVEIAARAGAGNFHCLWYFAAGRGNVFELADPDEIFDRLVPAFHRAKELGITIDNIEQIRRQVFGPCGTIYDGNNSGWESIAIGPDGNLYPSPALVGVQKLKTELDDDLASAWRHSNVLEQLRRSTVAGETAPMLMIIGGSDQDHSYIRSGEFVGFDPYWSLYEKIALWLIAEKAREHPAEGLPRLRLKMGEVIAHSESRRQVSLRHTKSLIAVASKEKTIFIRDFYSHRVQEQPEVTFNSVLLPESQVSHIPSEYRVRSYCFSSPSLEIDFLPGQCVVELGSDTGIDCLIASKQVGPEGFVLGIEFQDALLDWSRRAARDTIKNLGYRNVEFIKTHTHEPLPIKGESADVVIINCSINRAADKRHMLTEVFRILRPQGQLVISDVVCDDHSDSSICTENILCGEYASAALTSRDLLGLLDEVGFVQPEILQWLPHRVIPFFSFYRMTLEVHKSAARDRQLSVMYRGPFASVLTSRGTLLIPGIFKTVYEDEIEGIGENIFIFEDPEHEKRYRMK